MANPFFSIKINTDDVAQKLGVASEFIHQTLYNAVNGLVASTHAFIIQKANDELEGWKRKYFLGENGENVKLDIPTRGVWVIELDPKVKWLEEGRESTFMRWLLDNNPKAKVSKDGKKYAVIPMTHKRGAGGPMKARTSLADQMLTKALKLNQTNLKSLERGIDAKPMLGIMRKLNMPTPENAGEFASLFSKPRSAAMAAKTGLKAHSGIFHFKNAVITQKPGDRKGSVKREITTFRVIHEAHEVEGRWQYPEVKPFNSIPAAHEYAQKEWDEIYKDLERKFKETM